MHEVSLMMSIMDTISEEAQIAGAERVTVVRLLIGEKAGVVVDALRFAFEVVTRDSIAEGAELIIDRVPLRGRCLSCGREFDCDDFLVCRYCGGFGEILSGRELSIQSIEVE